MTATCLAAELIFDGDQLHRDTAVMIRDGVVEALVPRPPGLLSPLPGIIAPGFVDLQVNGGGGLMVEERTDLDRLARICAAHRTLGCAGVLPTLISDDAQATDRVLSLGVQAARARMPGFLGLHLEGPHLDPARAGAHDPARIRPMTDADLTRLIRAAAHLPALMVTLAPEAVMPAQIAALAHAGIIVSLGHTDCTLPQAQTAFGAGARSVTHLFNAMRQMGHRDPGLVGAVLAGDAMAGLIADGVHVDPAVVSVALRARPQGLYLVSDCMAVAGTDLTGCTLQGRVIRRHMGRLTLTDGTLAGADLRLDRAMRMVVACGAPMLRALRMATSIPADLIGARAGRIAPGRDADLIHLDPDLHLRAVLTPDGWCRTSA